MPTLMICAPSGTDDKNRARYSCGSNKKDLNEIVLHPSAIASGASPVKFISRNGVLQVNLSDIATCEKAGKNGRDLICK